MHQPAEPLKRYRIVAMVERETETEARDIVQAAAWARFQCARAGSKLLRVEEIVPNEGTPVPDSGTNGQP
jgi:hypothetical protein